MATSNTKTESTSIITATILRDGAGAAEGLKLEFAGIERDPLIIMAGDLAEHIQYEAQVHGLKQKLVDAAAIARNTETGRSATVEDKYEAVREVYDRLTLAEGATWNKIRAKGDGEKGALLVRALMQFKSQDRDTVTAWLAGKSEEEKAALRLNPKIKTIIDSLRVEPKVTEEQIAASDALLASLGD